MNVVTYSKVSRMENGVKRHHVLCHAGGDTHFHDSHADRDAHHAQIGTAPSGWTWWDSPLAE